MTGGDLLAIVAGLVAIGLVNWWFFVAGDGGPQSHEHHHH